MQSHDRDDVTSETADRILNIKMEWKNVTQQVRTNFKRNEIQYKRVYFSRAIWKLDLWISFPCQLSQKLLIIPFLENSKKWYIEICKNWRPFNRDDGRMDQHQDAKNSLITFSLRTALLSSYGYVAHTNSTYFWRNTCLVVDVIPLEIYWQYLVFVESSQSSFTAGRGHFSVSE